MNIFWIILIIVICVIIIFIIFLLVIDWAFSQGFKNKFENEWLPYELGISFDYFDVSSENQKMISYLFSENKTCEIKINEMINNYNQIKPSTVDGQTCFWIKTNEETYEFLQVENNKLKAIFLLNDCELKYFK